MDIRRVILYAALVFVSYTLWTNWQLEHPNVINNQTSITENASNEHLVPNIPAEDSANNEKLENINTKEYSKKPIIVKTDVLDLAIDLEHGDIINAKLLEYPESVDEKDKAFTLLTSAKDELYVANSSLFVVNGKETENADAAYTSSEESYQMRDGQDKLIVTLTGKNSNNILVKKEFEFTKGSYLINVRYLLTNEGSDTWKGYMNTQLERSSPTEDKSSMFHVGSFTGASFSNPGQTKYKKVSFKDIAKSNLNVDVNGGWIAMQQHYFLTAWAPLAESKSNFYTRALDGDYTIGAVSKALVIAPSETAQIGSRLYLGPEINSVLKEIAPSLDITVDYGFLWFISSLLFSLMKAIYSIIGNWGWSIVLVTFLIKLAFYRLSATSYKSMANMRKLQPKLLALRERFGDDKAKISQATMELYRQEKVNPLGGCLPIVIQIPVFMALYWVLLESVELRQAPFIFWIKDLAQPDPFHILPVIMGATMLIQQRLNPAPPDPMQAKIMMFLPVLFTALFWNFPSGLVLYWIVNNSLSILQQWYITRKYSEDKPAKLAIAK